MGVMDSLVSSVLNALGGTAVGGGVVRFIHQVWWHLASILSWAWILGQGKAGSLTAVSDFLSYLGLPDMVREAPLHGRAWIVGHPELGIFVGLLLVIGLLVDLRPWGERWIDEPMSPAGATAVLMALYLVELSGVGVLWSVGALVGILLALKWFVQAPQATLYAVVAPVLTLLYTPLAIGSLLFSPADAESMERRPAGGSHILE